MTKETVSNTLLTRINEIAYSICADVSEKDEKRSEIVEKLTRAYITLNSQ